MKKANIKNTQHSWNEDIVNYDDAWEMCVSTASSFLSTNWKETFFATREGAKAFAKYSKSIGLAVLVVTPDEY